MKTKSTKRTMTTKMKNSYAMGWVEVKIRAKGKSKTKTNDRTESTTTHKQDSQDTPSGRRIVFYPKSFLLDQPIFLRKPSATSP